MNTCRLTLLLSTCFLNSLLCGMQVDTMNQSYLLTVLDKMQRGENIIFTKYGDGEYLCMIGADGANCDGDRYHQWLGERLKTALISLSKKPNTYIGKWWTQNVADYCDAIAKQFAVTVPWVWYHLFMNDDEFLNHGYMHQFVDFLIHTDRKKILVCNKMNARLKDFFHADVYIEIPERSWSFDYDTWKKQLEKVVEKDSIVLISAGLCSKVLIDDITNEYELTFIDLGSSFDLLARKWNSRGWKHSYAQEVDYYKDLLPANW